MSSPNYQAPSSSKRKVQEPKPWTQVLNEALQAKRFTNFEWKLHKFNDGGNEMHIATFYFNGSQSFTSYPQPSVRAAKEEAAGFALFEVNQYLARLGSGYRR